MKILRNVPPLICVIHATVIHFLPVTMIIPVTTAAVIVIATFPSDLLD